MKAHICGKTDTPFRYVVGWPTQAWKHVYDEGYVQQINKSIVKKRWQRTKA